MKRLHLAALAAGLLMALWNVTPLSGFVFSNISGGSTLDSRSAIRWPFRGEMVADVQLGTRRTPLSDGSASFDEVFNFALGDWTWALEEVQGAPVLRTRVATRATGQFNNVNDVFFNDHAYGEAFPASTVAVALKRYVFHEHGYSNLLEADVIFNSRFAWDSYEGNSKPGVLDFYRVALHEAGHMLGLHHPDEAQQREVAIMNSHEGDSDLDRLQEDDIRGIRALYSLELPGRPIGATAAGSGSVITANWDHPFSGGEPTGYFVEVGTGPGLTSRRELTGTPRPTLSLGGFSSGTYYVRVKGVNWAGAGPASGDIVVTVRDTGCTLPGMPTMTVISSTGGASGATLVLGWTVPSGNPTSYTLYSATRSIRDQDLNEPWVTVRDAGNAATATLVNLQAGTYYYRVRARNACGFGPVSTPEVVANVQGPVNPTRTYSVSGNATWTVRRPNVTIGTCYWDVTFPYRVTWTFTVGSNNAVNGNARVTGTIRTSGYHDLCLAYSAGIDVSIPLTGTAAAMGFDGVIARPGSGNVYRAIFTNGRYTGDSVTGTLRFTYGGADGSGEVSGNITAR